MTTEPISVQSTTATSSSRWFSRWSLDLRPSIATTRTTAVKKFSNSEGQSTEGFAPQQQHERLLAVEADRQKVSRCKTCARKIVDHMLSICFTSLLTIWALIGDDVRLTCTEMPADIGFNIVTFFCIGVFTIEICLSCIGKPDYFPGFFFILDVVSTGTMLLDITFINDALLAQSDDDVDNLKASKTTKIGARAARIVRVLRLVRLLKLYKNIYEARQKQQRARALERKRQHSQEKDSEDWDDDEEDEEDGLNGMKVDEMAQESTVGRKLSEMTIRRVIILVLSVMMVLPLLSADETGQYPFSAVYGADVVHRSFEAYTADLSLADNYYDDMLRYIYTHNWFTGHSDSCPAGAKACPEDYLSHLFWFGFGTTESNGYIPPEQVDLAQLTSQSVQRWEDKVAVEADMLYQYGSVPVSVQERLSTRWDQSCHTDTATIQGLSLLSEKIPGVIDYKVKCPDDLRKIERKKYTPTLLSNSAYQELHFSFYFDLRPALKEEAVYNLLTTLFICALLCCSAAVFAADANALVLKPLENMMVKVRLIRKNPSIAARLAEQEYKKEEKRKAAQKSESSSAKEKLMKLFCCDRGDGVMQPMETTVLEKTIIKLGTLLSLGLGEAGTGIIAQKLQAETGSVAGMLPGKRYECVIGYARISNFSTMTEVLQVKTVTFVNQVAEIVHGVVNQFHGSPNKNNGDTFLLIWRDIDADDSKSRRADMALYAFAKILGAVHTSPILAKYRTHPGLQQRLGRKCKVDLTFGLHEGWAIEGALGTEYKIDASYLSPNVSIAESIERATVAYGVNLLVTEALRDILTWEMAKKLRLIDVVVVRGQSTPMKLYVLDLNTHELHVTRRKHWKWSIRQRFRVRQFLQQEKDQRGRSDVPMSVYFDGDPEVRTMRSLYTPEFKLRFNMGFQNYQQGEWQAAETFLRGVLLLLGVEDGPSLALLRFMETHNFVAPDDWPGHHVLFQASLQNGTSSRRNSGVFVSAPKGVRRTVSVDVWATRTTAPESLMFNSPREPTKQVHVVSFETTSDHCENSTGLMKLS